MISDSTIKAIQDAVETKTLRIDGVEYATRAVVDVRKPDPKQDALDVSGLTGIVEYLAAHDITTGEPIGPGLEVPIVHIRDYSRVDLVTTPFGFHKQRDVLATAKCLKAQFEFEAFHAPDEFVIALLTQFVQTEQTAILLNVVGNMSQEAETRVLDDGVGQEVSVRKGVSLKARAQVPSPVILQPYRTFREVEQPESPFALRVDDGPSVALFEAAGETWTIEAVKRIKDWLREHLPEGFPIIG